MTAVSSAARLPKGLVWSQASVRRGSAAVSILPGPACGLFRRKGVSCRRQVVTGFLCFVTLSFIGIFRPFTFNVIHMLEFIAPILCVVFLFIPTAFHFSVSFFCFL